MESPRLAALIRHMRLVAAGVLLIALGLAGLLAYVNYISETERGGGGLVKTASWIAVAIGLALITVGVATRLRRRSSRFED